MNPDLRAGLLFVALIFVGLFAAATLQVISEDGLDILTVSSIVIVVLLALPLIGALRNPPRR